MIGTFCGKEKCLKYAVPGISTLLAAMAWIGEQWISQTFSKTFSTTPWGWLLLIVGSFLVGLVYADSINENSALREKMRDVSRIVDVDNFVLAHRITEDACWYEAIIHVHFLKKKKHAICTMKWMERIGLRLREYDGSVLLRSRDLT